VFKEEKKATSAATLSTEHTMRRLLLLFVHNAKAESKMGVTVDGIDPLHHTQCQELLNGWCNGPSNCLAKIAEESATGKIIGTLHALFQGPGSPQWRCYSETVLDDTKTHYFGGKDFCEDDGTLSQLSMQSPCGKPADEAYCEFTEGVDYEYFTTMVVGGYGMSKDECCKVEFCYMHGFAVPLLLLFAIHD
jgi:hypothetical protein